MEQSAIYRIRIRGELNTNWLDRLGIGILRVEPSEAGKVVTVLQGRLRDQAALSGLLNTLYELHLPVISVETIDKEEK